jgi:ferric-dicitrate binding protein FerR (iron transport regulator)
MDASERRARELLSAVLDETCSDAERDELQALLRQYPQLAAGLADQALVHSLLLWQSEDITECIDLELAASDAQSTPGEAQAPPRRMAVPPWTWALAASVLIAAGLAVWQGFQQSGQRETAQADVGAIGEIVEEQEVFWSNASTALPKAELRRGRLIYPVYPGALQTNAGAYTIRFKSGSTLYVSGGSSLTIESDMLVRLDRGRATAEVNASAIGFTVKTPLADVVDQGTQFGVAVGDAGQTDVAVFEGKVDLWNRGADSRIQLVRGDGVSVDPKGVVGALTRARRNLNWGWWTRTHLDGPESVILEVSDNVPSSDGSRYPIAFGGLEDDVFAYVDHRHQWNGLTTAGLPEFLRGADYVRTFNDYRYKHDFRMQIKFSGPATLYVFFDNRVPVLPSWLKQGFEDTGVDIGQDEGPWPPHEQALRPDLPMKVNAEGGGQSIDSSFSVWRRRCKDGESVTLGPVGASSEARSMYGVAATQLE